MIEHRHRTTVEVEILPSPEQTGTPEPNQPEEEIVW